MWVGLGVLALYGKEEGPSDAFPFQDCPDQFSVTDSYADFRSRKQQSSAVSAPKEWTSNFPHPCSKGADCFQPGKCENTKRRWPYMEDKEFITLNIEDQPCNIDFSVVDAAVTDGKCSRNELGC